MLCRSVRTSREIVGKLSIQRTEMIECIKQLFVITTLRASFA